MRLRLLALLGVGLISQAFGQWQEMPVPVVAGHLFSADEVTPRKLSPNLNDDPTFILVTKCMFLAVDNSIATGSADKIAAQVKLLIHY